MLVHICIRILLREKKLLLFLCKNYSSINFQKAFRVILFVLSRNQFHYEKNQFKLMDYNSTNINKTNNDILPQII
jgi:hypothetical protein